MKRNSSIATHIHTHARHLGLHTDIYGCVKSQTTTAPTKTKQCINRIERKETHKPNQNNNARINREPNELSALKITIYISGSAIYGRHSVAD